VSEAATLEVEGWEGEGREARPFSDQASPHLSVKGFQGPLDFLPEMVRRQQVDLRLLSILTLTDQLVAAIERGGGHIRLERRADWLVMASQLLLLKAQLLAPASPEAAEEAGAEAARRLEMLDELARMRAAADWLAARPQLGQVVFGGGQGRPTPPRPQAELYVAFLEATLAMLEGREENEGAPTRPTDPPHPISGASRMPCSASPHCSGSTRPVCHSSTACRRSRSTRLTGRSDSGRRSPAPWLLGSNSRATVPSCLSSERHSEPSACRGLRRSQA
jgi:segregation and condensation protein A